MGMGWTRMTNNSNILCTTNTNNANNIATTDRGEWNDRWFVLVDSELMCYRSERWEEEGEKAMITLDLTECAVSEHVEFEEEAPRSKGHHFQVVAPHITLQMSAVEVRWGWDGRE